MQPPKKLAGPLQPRRAYVLDLDKAGRAPKAPKKTGLSRRGRILGTVVVGMLATLVVAGLGVVLATPGCVKREAIRAAAAQGITLTVEDVQLGSGRLELVGVGAIVTQVPEVKAAAQAIDIETSGLTVTSLLAKQLVVSADGPFDKVVADIAAWRAARAGGGAGGGGAPEPRLVVESGRLVWTKPFGETSSIDADAAHGDLTQKSGGEELHVSSSQVKVGGASGSVGPWRVDFDRDPASSRLRILFDPLVPDGPNALVVSTEGAVSTVEVNVARSPLARLGVPPATVGLPGGDSSQLEAKVNYLRHAPNRVDLVSNVALYGVRLEGAPAPIDVKLDLSISGDPERALDIKKSDLAIGPMKGAAVGTLKPFPDGFRLDLAYKAGPVPCAAFAPAPGTSTAADLAEQLRSLAQATGLAKVTGDVRVEGSLLLDTRDFGQTRLSLVPAATCGVTLFPRL